MSDEAAEKKGRQAEDHQAPAGARTSLAWTSEDGHVVNVEVASEWIVLRKKEKPAAEIFHTYYRLAGAAEARPVTFVFNGGPGAASAYLHVGGLGPLRVQFEADGNVPPPVRLINNPESWIAFTDLVFIDPVGTGFSRVVEQEAKASDKDKPDPSKSVDEQKFFGLNRDLESLCEFIERFLSKHRLWKWRAKPTIMVGRLMASDRLSARRLTICSVPARIPLAGRGTNHALA